ncbi:MAG: nucleotide exchange factor GrpE [Chloroflexota bacterium]|nr:nucleotide exchange factor GrpE [Chloroflexota bacterium]
MTQRRRTNGDGQAPAEPDREHMTRGEERVAELDTSPAALATQLDELRTRLAAAEQEAQEMRAAWQRTAADYANYRRRTEQDREQTLGLANEALLSKLLPIVDDFDRAIAQMPAELGQIPWVTGIVAIDRKLRQLLDSEGLTPIEAEGQQFDPRQHEAVVHEETAHVPEGTVTAELQRGYRLRDRILRPALVAVAKTPQNESNADRGETEED